MSPLEITKLQKIFIRERERQTERQRDRETERQRQPETERQRQTETAERQKDRDRGRDGTDRHGAGEMTLTSQTKTTLKHQAEVETQSRGQRRSCSTHARP